MWLGNSYTYNKRVNEMADKGNNEHKTWSREAPTQVNAICKSANYEGLWLFKGASLRTMLNNARKCFDRCRMDLQTRWKTPTAQTEASVEPNPPEYQIKGCFDDYLSLKEYCEFIYFILLINPNMLTISEFYNYPLDFAPYLYNPTAVMKEGSEAIYYLLEDRIQTAALHKQIDREVAINLLREKYSWEKNNTQNVNLNAVGATVDFQFGDANLNNPTDKTDNK